MFECWEHWKEERSWPDMMMSGAPCDAIMCNDLPSFHFPFLFLSLSEWETEAFFVDRYLECCFLNLNFYFILN